MSTSHLPSHSYIITGAGTGIGAAIAQRLSRPGVRLTLLGRREELLRRSAAACVALGADVVVRPCDVRDAQAVRLVVDEAGATGPITAVIANAGIGGGNQPGPGDRWDDLLATNLSGTYHAFRAAEPHLVEGGHLLAISSILARIGVAGYTGYCASKAGILGLVRALALELAPRRIQVNALCPGWVETDMAWEGLDGIASAIGGSRDEAIRLAMRDVPLGRMGTPAEVAGTVAWMLSPDARGLTGQGIDLNGGAWMA